MSNLINFHSKSKKQNSSSESGKQAGQKTHKQIFFTPTEFKLILSAYTNQVAKNEWRDYAIDSTSQMAAFYIFRHSHEHFLFAINKRKNGKNWEFSLKNQKRIIKRSPDIAKIIALLQHPLKLV